MKILDIPLPDSTLAMYNRIRPMKALENHAMIHPSLFKDGGVPVGTGNFNILKRFVSEQRYDLQFTTGTLV